MNKTIPIIVALSIAFYNIFCIVAAQDDSNTEINTFKDPIYGITFLYPSGWQVISQEVSKDLTEETKDYLLEYDLVDRTTVVVDMESKSASGAFLTIVSEILPFPMTVEQYMMENEKIFDILDIKAGKSRSISVEEINGLKLNVT